MTRPIRLTCCSFVLSALLSTATARAVWLSDVFEPLTDDRHLFPRQSDVCGGDVSLSSCGDDFPSDFCCSLQTTCLALNTSAVTASICCPQGMDCTTIGPVSCDRDLQNATLFPTSQLHAEPTQTLQTCGDGCCPMGYECEGGQCNALPANVHSDTSASISEPEDSAAKTPSSPAADDAQNDSDSAALGNAPSTQSTNHFFNGKSFAAGFVPGILVGVFITSCLIFLVLRRRKSERPYYTTEKIFRDTLTDLSSDPFPVHPRPTLHGRSISEPRALSSAGYRTEFLHGSLPYTTGSYTVDISSPASGPAVATPSRTPRLQSIFPSRSPFTCPSPQPMQSPMPAHLKRGTLSFKISPVRALKKQKSMHSLRRQMATDMARHSTLRPGLNDHSRSPSTETIHVLMSRDAAAPSTPDALLHPASACTDPDRYLRAGGSWASTASSDLLDAHSPRGLGDFRVAPTYVTPTHPPIGLRAERAVLTSPDTPVTPAPPVTPTRPWAAAATTKGMLDVPHAVDDARRDTTFSALMEKAGLRKSDLIPLPPGKRRWGPGGGRT